MTIRRRNALAVVIIAAAAAACAIPPASVAPSLPGGPPSPGLPTGSPSAPVVVESPPTPCRADVEFSGGYTGSVHGSVVSDVRPTGGSPEGAVFDTRLPVDIEDVPRVVIFALWDPDGPIGPVRPSGLFGADGGTIPQVLAEGDGAGTAKVEPDGSSATFDVNFVGGFGRDTHVVGSLTCTPFR